MLKFTPYIWLDIIIYVLLAFLVMIAYNVAQIYYLRKLKPNKWLLLGLTVVVILLSSYLSARFNLAFIALIGVVLAIFLMLWTFERFKDKKSDIKTDIKGKKVKEIVNKPKAKPNRAKKKENN